MRIHRSPSGAGLSRFEMGRPRLPLTAQWRRSISGRWLCRYQASSPLTPRLESPDRGESDDKHEQSCSERIGRIGLGIVGSIELPKQWRLSCSAQVRVSVLLSDFASAPLRHTHSTSDREHCQTQHQHNQKPNQIRTVFQMENSSGINCGRRFRLAPMQQPRQEADPGKIAESESLACMKSVQKSHECARKKGRPAPRSNGRRSGQAKVSPPPARLPRTGSDESRNYRPAQAGEIGNFTTRVYTDGRGNGVGSDSIGSARGLSRKSWAAHRRRATWNISPQVRAAKEESDSRTGLPSHRSRSSARRK